MIRINSRKNKKKAKPSELRILQSGKRRSVNMWLEVFQV